MKQIVIKNLRLDVIATYDTFEQEWFSCAVKATALQNEKTLIEYVKEQLEHPEDLVKLSLCWEYKGDSDSEQKQIMDIPVIKESISKNAKYFFEPELERIDYVKH